ncbi:hypothetical protein [Sulfurovum sp.]|uniref:hypothetical protein n=1 Tax=Sulfurovum sp. TaxID=1969726 RepID=UPI002A370875|nr:hypothetical protein [Sulfurovum sp.]MDY0402209.1 hypothetical protein [Sulfurovum sp.]
MESSGLIALIHPSPFYELTAFVLLGYLIVQDLFVVRRSDLYLERYCQNTVEQLEKQISKRKIS